MQDKETLSTGFCWKAGLIILGEVSTWIVVPIVLALIFGRMLDTHFDTKPFIFIGLAGVGFLVTCFGMYKVVKKHIQEMQEISPDVKSGSRPESVGADKEY